MSTYREPPPRPEPRVLVMSGRSHGRYMLGSFVLFASLIAAYGLFFRDGLAVAVFFGISLGMLLLGLPRWFQRIELAAFDDDDVLQVTRRRWPLRRQSFTVPLSSAQSVVNAGTRGNGTLHLKL